MFAPCLRLGLRSSSSPCFATPLQPQVKKKELLIVRDYYELAADESEDQPGCWRHDPEAMSQLGGPSCLATGVARVGVLHGVLRRLSGKDQGEKKWQFDPDDVKGGPRETAASSSSAASTPMASFVFTETEVEQCITWSTGVTAKGTLRLPEPQPGNGAAALAAGPEDAGVGTAEAYGGGIRVRLEDGREQRLAIVEPEALRRMWHTVAARGGGALGGSRLSDLKDHATLLCVPLATLGQLSRDNVRARLRSYMADATVSDGASDDSEDRSLGKRVVTMKESEKARGEGSDSGEGLGGGDPEGTTVSGGASDDSEDRPLDKRVVTMRESMKARGEGSDSGEGLEGGDPEGANGIGDTDEDMDEDMDEACRRVEACLKEDVLFTINVGDDVEAQFGSRNQWYDAQIRGLGQTDGRFDVAFDDGDSDRDVSPCRLRPRRGDKPAAPARHGEGSALRQRVRDTAAYMLGCAKDTAPQPARKARAPKRPRRPEYEWTPTSQEESAFAKMLADGGVSESKVASKAAWLGLLKRFGTTHFVTQGEAGYESEEAAGNSAAGSTGGQRGWARKDPSAKAVGVLLPLAAAAFYELQEQRDAANSALRKQSAAKRQELAQARDAVRAAKDKQLQADRATLEAARDDPLRTIHYRCEGQPASAVAWSTLVKGIGVQSIKVQGGNGNVYVHLSRNVDRSGVLGRRGWTENTFRGTQEEWRTKYNKERPGGDTKEGTEWGRAALVAWLKDKQNTNNSADPQGRATLDYEHGYAPLEGLLMKSGVTLRGSVPLFATRRAGAEDVPHVTNAFTPIPGKKPTERPSCGPVRAFASPRLALLLTLHFPPLRVSPRCGTQPCIGSTNWASTTTVRACCITALMATWASRNFSGLPRCR